MQLSGGRFCAPGSVRPAPSVPGGRPPLPSPWSCGRRGGCSAPSRCHAAPCGGSVAPLPPVFINGRLRCGRAWGGLMGRPGWGLLQAARLLLRLQGGCKLQGCCKRTGRNQRQLIRKASAAAARLLQAARCTRLQGQRRGGSDPPRAESQNNRQGIHAPRTWGQPPAPQGKTNKTSKCLFSPDSSGQLRTRGSCAPVGRLGGGPCASAAGRRLDERRPERLRSGAAAVPLLHRRRSAPPNNCTKLIFCAIVPCGILTPVCAAAHERPSGWGVDILTPVCYTMYGGALTTPPRQGICYEQSERDG